MSIIISKNILGHSLYQYFSGKTFFFVFEVRLGPHCKKRNQIAMQITLVKRNMFTKDVRIDLKLNKEIWKNGIRNLPTKIEIIIERKKIKMN